MKSTVNQYFKIQNSILVSVLCAVLAIFSQPVFSAVIIKDIALTLKATPNPVAVNSKLTYTFTVKNIGTQAVDGVVLKDPLPANVGFVSAPPNCKFASANDKKKNLITCSTNRLLTKTSVVWSVTVKTPAKKGTLKNSASINFKGIDKTPLNNSASVITAISPGNRAPVASSISLRANAAIPYIEQKLIGTDADKDTLSYILNAPINGKGYKLAHVNSRRGILYVTILPKFKGTISLPYRVSDGKRYSAPATVKIVVQPSQLKNKGLGNKAISAALYASFRKANLPNNLFGAPGEDPSEPASIDLSSNFPAVGDQGRQGSCVGWASAYALKTYQEGMEMKWPLDTPTHLFSPAYIYNQINGGQDKGSQIYDALDLIIKQGAASLASTPYRDNDYLTQPSNAAQKEASGFKALSKSVVNGTQDIKAALANRKPVVIGMELYPQFKTLSGSNSVYNSKQGNMIGGHAVTIVGYDNNRYGGAFKVINSWSGAWGDNGYFWMPYSFAEQVVKQSYILEDGKNNQDPVNPDVVNPPLPGRLPNLQVKSWNANFDTTIGSSGKMEWSVINSGRGKAPAGATVAIMLSKDNVINANDTYVIYDKIPFGLEAGDFAYRSFDENNSIGFKIPSTIDPGDYYMALWVDDLNTIQESKENDNTSLSRGIINFNETLSDLEVQSWYADPYDFSGNYDLTYEVINAGTQTVPKNFSVAVVLSRSQNLTLQNTWGLYYEKISFSLAADDSVYRDKRSPGHFNLYHDVNGSYIPPGYFYMALWVDAENRIAEADNDNNASFSSGTISTYLNGASLKNKFSNGMQTDGNVIAPNSPIFNGKKLPPADLQMRKVKISVTPNGKRKIEFLSNKRTNTPTKKINKEKIYSKTLSADNNVIFPVSKSILMPISR
jgi:uncharacterized repeat protein (TIGR01451 family)